MSVFAVEGRCSIFRIPSTELLLTSLLTVFITNLKKLIMEMTSLSIMEYHDGKNNIIAVVSYNCTIENVDLHGE